MFRRKTKKIDTRRDLAESERSLAQATAMRAEQERKRAQEDESVTKRLERLAGEDANHLGMMVLRALTERYGPVNGGAR